MVAHEGIEVEDTAIAMFEFKSGARGGSTACWFAERHPAEVQITGSERSVFMSDDKFRVWEFKNELPKDVDIRASFGLNNSADRAGAADPSSIDFSWH